MTESATQKAQKQAYPAGQGMDGGYQGN